MPNRLYTTFQNMSRVFDGAWNVSNGIANIKQEPAGNEVIYTTDDPQKLAQKKLELQQNKYLQNRWVRANQNLSMSAFAGLSNIKLMYRDADLMDSYPEIGAALDLISEECLSYDTPIKLLNGITKTIGELYDEDYKDFWVYSVDENGTCMPSHVDKVICKGEQELFEVTLDDGTIIKCTPNHQWMMSDCSWKRTDELTNRDSLMSIYDNLNYLGYEQIKSTVENKKRLTHRIVAENVLHDKKLELAKNNQPFQKIVIHHKSFNKLNNDPSQLVYMYWNDHQKLHTDLNAQRWQDETFAKKMSAILSEHVHKLWSSDKVNELKAKFSESGRNYKASLTEEAKKKIYGLPGEKNGMYGVHRFGNENPNYNHLKKHVDDINIDEYVEYLLKFKNANTQFVAAHFDLTDDDRYKVNAKICQKFGIKTIKQLRQKIGVNIPSLITDANFFDLNDYMVFLTTKSHKITEDKLANTLCTTQEVIDELNSKIFNTYHITKLSDTKFCCRNNNWITRTKTYIKNHPYDTKEEIYKRLKLNNDDFMTMIRLNGYKDYEDIKKSVNNHRIVSVRRLQDKGLVFDLFNSSCNHCFGVKCNKGHVISHNCALTSSESHGMIVKVSSKSDRIKSILEDLFVNRLNLQVTAQMVMRAMCKYGNQFMLLDIDKDLGVKGWRQLPVAEVERIENGIVNPYGGGGQVYNATNDPNAPKDLSTRFVWTNEQGGQMVPFRNWQIAHFRLLHNSLFLPYGSSVLLSARRHFRMLALMEDMMLIYRLERSMERRVYKIYVGALDDDDIGPFVDRIADQFKRTPIVDPLTGQLDLRKNLLPVWSKTPIPLLDGRTITIEELAKEYENGKENYVYSVQDSTHKIVPGKVVWCGKNYTAEKMYKITLDDDSYMVMAGEHEIVMRDGSKKRADEVVAGESVMPFYRKNENIAYAKESYYEQIYNPNSGKYEYTHRLIANTIAKNKSSNNTVHHKNFNKFDNRPCNLQWMDWKEHRDYHISLNTDSRIREVRKQEILTRWAKNGYREKACRNMTTAFDDYVWNEIEAAIANKIVYTQKTAIDYVNNNLIDYLLTINSSQKLHHYKKITKPVFKARVTERGYSNFAEYLNEMFVKYNLGNPKDRLSLQKSEAAKKGNVVNNFRERWENTSKRIEIIEKLREYGRKQDHTKSAESNKINFDEHIWNDLRLNIINGNLNNQKDIVEYLNINHLDYINNINNKKLISISKDSVGRRIKELGFNNTKDYIVANRKNHKIKSIEIIGGDDVYCMTVVGQNDEEDRHNFALRTFNEDESWNECGCFVSNCASEDLFIPVRDASAPTPIDTLPAAKNLDAIEDIKYIQKKVCAALRIPQSFLNFEEATGDGKNLALMDVRFARTINRYQQSFLMELTKIATIHLYLLGFEDDLTNFNLTMNNPSTQAEQLEIENLQKKISAARDAVSDPGNGIPIMSLQRALKEILKWSDKEIKENFEEIRLEKALAAEYEKTAQIIKRTGVFDNVDRIYGEPGAEYQEDQGGPQGPDGGGPMGGSGGFGGGLDDMGSPSADEGIDVQGEEGMEPTQDMGGAPQSQEQPAGGQEGMPMESINKNKKPLLNESKILSSNKDHTTQIFNQMVENMNKKQHEGEIKSRVDVYDKSLMISEEFNNMFNVLEDFKNSTIDD